MLIEDIACGNILQFGFILIQVCVPLFNANSVKREKIMEKFNNLYLYLHSGEGKHLQMLAFIYLLLF